MSQQSGLNNWLEDYNKLIDGLCKRLDEEDKKYNSTLQNDQPQYQQLNQIVYNNQDVFTLKYENSRFILTQFMFSKRYQPSICQVKLFNNISEREIDQKKYNNSLFEFSIDGNNVILTILSSQKQNNQQNNDNLLIKEVYIGYLKDVTLTLFLIKDLNKVQQVEFHPLSNQYILILTSDKDSNKQHIITGPQFLYIYFIGSLKQPIMRLNIESCMDSNACAFTFARDTDDNQFLIYFLNKQGVIYYYNLMLPNMICNIKTKSYIKSINVELSNYLDQINSNQFKNTYDCSKEEIYQNGKIIFSKLNNFNYQLPKSVYITFTKTQIIDFNLFIIICKLQNGNISIFGIIDQNFTGLYEIHQEELLFENYQFHQNYSNLSQNQPKIIYNKNKIEQITTNQFDIQNRNQILITFQNSFIILDYSNIIQFQQDQSPINIVCLELNQNLEKEGDKQNTKQFTIKQALCVDLFNSKTLIIKGIQENGNTKHYILSQRLLSSLTDDTEEIIQQGLKSVEEKNSYNHYKLIIKNLKKKLIGLQQQIKTCKSEDEINKTIDELKKIVLDSIKPIAIKIKLQSENISNGLDLNLNGDLYQQMQYNIEMKDKISKKNDQIYDLLQSLRTISNQTINKQLQNVQKQKDLQQYQKQFDDIKDQIMNSREDLKKEIEDSKRNQLDIEVIQENLIEMIKKQN